MKSLGACRRLAVCSAANERVVSNAWTTKEFFRIGASSLLIDVERQLEHGLGMVGEGLFVLKSLFAC